MLQKSFKLMQSVLGFRLVPVAMEHAILDIITPVVERSVTIACMTTRELVVKVCFYTFHMPIIAIVLSFEMKLDTLSTCNLRFLYSF